MGGEMLADRIRRRESSPEFPAGWESLDEGIREEVLYRVCYRGYLEREQKLIDRLARADRIRLPPELDYSRIPGLRREAAERLRTFRPATLGQASRLSGVNPADVALLMVALKTIDADPGLPR